MAYTAYDIPVEFFGPGYTVDAGNNEIQLNTNGSGSQLLSLGVFTAIFSTNNELLIASHGLSVGHVVQVTNSGGVLPAPLVINTNYWVKTSTVTGVTLSATNGGAEIVLTTNGTGTSTLHSQPILANLSNAQAAASTAQTVFSIVDGINTRFNSIPTADKPTKFNITRTGYTDEATGELVYNYALTCRVTPGSLVAVNS